MEGIRTSSSTLHGMWSFFVKTVFLYLSLKCIHVTNANAQFFWNFFFFCPSLFLCVSK